MLVSVLIVFCICIILLYFLYTPYKKSNIKHPLTKIQHLRIKEPIILWDIHGVLFEKSFFRWLYIIVTYPYLFTILKQLDKQTMVLLLKYCGKKIKILKEEITNQELINHAQKMKNNALISLTMQISCAYKPKNGTIALVKKLNQYGYTQHIGSNIGKAVFELFAPQYPMVFSCFSYVHIVDTDHSKTIIKKPNKEFFLSYLQIHKALPQDILFIDDRWANIKTARDCGLQTIYFKNSAQLEKEFAKLGLFKKKNELI